MNKYVKKKNYTFVYNDSGNYILFNKNDLDELYNYFDSINYDNYLNIDTYNIEKLESNKKIIGEKLVLTLSSLHLKTLEYYDLSENEFNDIYNSIDKRINNLMNYYLDMQDYIEYFSFLREDYLYFMVNVSIFYKIISKAKYYLDKWYSMKIFRIRKVYCLNNVSLDNFIMLDKDYFIDYSNCREDLIEYDFVNFYKNELFNLDMDSLFNIYKSKINFSEDELYLFYSFICIPNKISFGDDININKRVIKDNLDYIDKTFLFLSKEDKEDQETDKDKFN